MQQTLLPPTYQQPVTMGSANELVGAVPSQPISDTEQNVVIGREKQDA